MHMKFDVITIFPQLFEAFFHESILKRGEMKKLLEFRVHNLRDFTDPLDPHKTVDDRIYGGGAGMLLKVEPLYGAVKSIVSASPEKFSKKVLRHICVEEGKKKASKVCKILEIKSHRPKAKIIMLDPKGKIFDQKKARELTRYENIVFVCGRYEGIDARVEKFIDEKISLGKFVLSGGEVAAQTIIEAVSRLVPGVLGNEESLLYETHNALLGIENLESPHFTRPERFSPGPGVVWSVPKVLLSGNHGKIKEWRKKKSS